MKRLLLSVMILSYAPLLTLAREAQATGDDLALENHVMRLSREFRCLVCQNETLADSRADLAVDLRTQIREQIVAGRSDSEITAFLTDRYGDFILYRPPVTPRTYLLWFGPFLTLGISALALRRFLKHRAGIIDDRPLSVEERKRAGRLLGEVGKGTL